MLTGTSTHGLRLPASCVPYLPEAQGSLPPGRHYCTYRLLPYVPRAALRTAYCISTVHRVHEWRTRYAAPAV